MSPKLRSINLCNFPKFTFLTIFRLNFMPNTNQGFLDILGLLQYKLVVFIQTNQLQNISLSVDSKAIFPMDSMILLGIQGFILKMDILFLMAIPLRLLRALKEMKTCTVCTTQHRTGKELNQLSPTINTVFGFSSVKTMSDFQNYLIEPSNRELSRNLQLNSQRILELQL